MISENEFINHICDEVEATLRVESCIMLKQKGSLLQGMYHGNQVFIPVRHSSLICNSMENKKQYCVNEIGKERPLIK